MAEWIKTNADVVFTIFGYVVAIVSLIVKLTATEKDDTVWAKILKVLSALSLVNPDGSIVGKK